MADKELKKITSEINLLKKKYEKALSLSTSYGERNELLKKINQLDEAKKSPSQMKSFGKTFGKGLNVVGSKLWSAIKSGSRNLSKNSPEFRELGNKMNQSKPSQPFSPMMDMYMPSQSEPLKMKVPKRLKKAKMKSVKKFSKAFNRQVNNPTWGLP